MRSLRPRADERALTWLVTGPIGHFAAGLIDCIGLLIRIAWAQGKGHVRRRWVRS